MDEVLECSSRRFKIKDDVRRERTMAIMMAFAYQFTRGSETQCKASVVRAML